MSPDRKSHEPEKERFGKCPVDAQFTDEAVTRIMANEYLCQDEYGVGVGDPQTGWWSVNWVNSPAMGPEPLRKGPDEESRRPPSK